jgi:DNA-binding XRE family transcriptional regulator
LKLILTTMTKNSRITRTPPAAVEDALKRLGRNIRIARVRRKLRIEDVAHRIGASRFTVADLEKGKPSTSAAAYLGALWALGLLDPIADLADPDRDEEGKVLEGARSPKEAPRRRSLDNDF